MVPLTVGSVLSGRYRLEAPLGHGATSAVWRARDLDLGRVVAVKVLAGAGVDPELAGRFEREGQILGRLSHPNVVPVFATGTDEGRPYLVMAHVDGVDFDQVLADGPLPVDDALDTLADVAAGLGAAHQAGVVHRDVKPANVVCGRDGVPRLVDFGIARAADLTAMTRAETVLGTAGYLAPEQARGEVPGPATDVYALGCVLFQALTGRPPFQADSPVAVAFKHVNEEPPSVRSLRPEVPAAVDAVVQRCLAKDPADRYATGQALEADLRRVRAGEQPARAAEATAAMAPVGDGTMLLPAVTAAATAADAGGHEVIDPSPLVPPAPTDHRWGVAAAVAAFVVVLGLILGSMGGDGGGGTPPAQATDEVATTTTTLAPTTTAPPTTAAPAPPPAPRKGKGKKKR